MTDTPGTGIDSQPTLITGAPQDPRVGTDVAGYHIERLLGRGGMAVVYEAYHHHLGRRVALKVISPDLAADPHFRTRFIEESRSAAAIDHPNVVPIYEAGEAGGLLFIAMRLVHGEDLNAWIARAGRLDASSAVDVVGQVAAALDAAHAVGLVHRDVKPANILITRSGDGNAHVYLTDFGIAKHAGVSGGTQTGAVIGTLDYIAPEQIQGLGADARSDVYALGCVLYECLAGRSPFGRPDTAGTMYAHLQAPVPRITEVRPDLPPDMDNVIGWALAKDPAQRFQSAGHLAAAARQAAGTQPQMVPAGMSAGATVTVPPGPPSGPHWSPTTPPAVSGPHWSPVATPAPVSPGPGRPPNRRAGLIGGIAAAVVVLGGGIAGLVVALHHGSSPSPATSSSGPVASRSTADCGRYCSVLASDGFNVRQAFDTYDHDCDPNAPTTEAQCGASLDAAASASKTMITDLGGLVPPAADRQADSQLRTALADFVGGVTQAEAAIKADPNSDVTDNQDAMDALNQVDAAEKSAREALGKLPGGH